MARVDAETANSGQEAALLTSEAVEFLHLLRSRFAPCRQELLVERNRRQRRYDLGQALHSLPKIEHSGDSGWAVKPSLSNQALGQVMLACPPASELLSRGVSSGAITLIADFDDCLSPTWPNCLESHACLQKALNRAAVAAGKDSSQEPVVVFSPAAQLEPGGKTLPGGRDTDFSVTV